jgi:hypothetical protein
MTARALQQRSRRNEAVFVLSGATVEILVERSNTPAMARPQHLPELLEALLEPEIARFLVYPRVCPRVRNHVCRRKPLFFA